MHQLGLMLPDCVAVSSITEANCEGTSAVKVNGAMHVVTLECHRPDHVDMDYNVLWRTRLQPTKYRHVQRYAAMPVTVANPTVTARPRPSSAPFARPGRNTSLR